jgi:hypothetical protein
MAANAILSLEKSRKYGKILLSTNLRLLIILLKRFKIFEKFTTPEETQDVYNECNTQIWEVEVNDMADSHMGA